MIVLITISNCTLESPLSEQQAAVQEHLQCLTETEYMYLMNKFNVSINTGKASGFHTGKAAAGIA